MFDYVTKNFDFYMEGEVKKNDMQNKQIIESIIYHIYH